VVRTKLLVVVAFKGGRVRCDEKMYGDILAKRGPCPGSHKVRGGDWILSRLNRRL
jgi:hypothetical protein